MAAARRRRSQRAPRGFHFQQVIDSRSGRAPAEAPPRPAPFTEEPPSHPIHGPVVRRAMAWLQGVEMARPENAARTAKERAVIVAYNQELNTFLTVTLPAYNARATAHNEAVRAWNRECVRIKHQNANNVRN